MPPTQGLSVTRKIDERVVIRHRGAEIVVTVKQLAGESVRINFIAPPSVKINREEVQQRIDRELAERNKHFPYNLALAITRAFKALLP